MEAATENAHRVAHGVQDWISDGKYALVDSEDLEGVAATLRSASDKLKAEIAGRR